MSKVEINVAKPFKLNVPGEQQLREIAAGVQLIETELADHWYVKAHLVGGSEDDDANADLSTLEDRALRATERREAAEEAERIAYERVEKKRAEQNPDAGKKSATKIEGGAKTEGGEGGAKTESGEGGAKTESGQGAKDLI